MVRGMVDKGGSHFAWYTEDRQKSWNYAFLWNSAPRLLTMFTEFRPALWLYSVGELSGFGMIEEGPRFYYEYPVRWTSCPLLVNATYVVVRIAH